MSNLTEVVGIRPDVLPDERLVPGPLPLLSEGAMSFFTLIYVGPILGLIYYLFFWRTRAEKSHCALQQQQGNENYQILLNTAV